MSYKIKPKINQIKSFLPNKKISINKSSKNLSSLLMRKSSKRKETSTIRPRIQTRRDYITNLIKKKFGSKDLS